MRAHAHLAVQNDTAGRGATRVTRLRSEAPLMLRPTRPRVDPAIAARGLPGATCVSLAAAAAGPVGGDELHLDVDVGPEATLVLRTVAATVALPGPYGEASSVETTLRVGRDATLIYLPEPVIAAGGCRHRTVTRVELSAGAGLLAREELLLGRHSEPPGQIRQRLRLVREASPLYDQEFTAGPGVLGWESAAVTGGRRAIGSVLAAGPGFHPAPIAYLMGVEAARMRLDDETSLTTALAHEAPALRDALEAGIGPRSPEMAG
jgi:urease accessory protein